MEKLKMKSKDSTNENIEKIGKLFPNVITEAKDKDGDIIHAIDFEQLQQELSDEIVETIPINLARKKGSHGHCQHSHR